MVNIEKEHGTKKDVLSKVYFGDTSSFSLGNNA